MIWIMFSAKVALVIFEICVICGSGGGKEMAVHQNRSYKKYCYEFFLVLWWTKSKKGIAIVN